MAKGRSVGVSDCRVVWVLADYPIPAATITATPIKRRVRRGKTTTTKKTVSQPPLCLPLTNNVHLDALLSPVVCCCGSLSIAHEAYSENKTKQTKIQHTTGGIPRWSPTLVLVARFSAYVWQSGRDAQFSLTYGRMCLKRDHQLCHTNANKD